MYELRVLNGLHEGAALPLSGNLWWIGNAVESDLQLCDNGIKARHCQLMRQDDPAGQQIQWQLQAEDGVVCNREGERQTMPFNIVPGEIFTLNGVWICLEAAEAAWASGPAVSQPAAQSVAQPEMAFQAASNDGRIAPTPAKKSLIKRLLPPWAQITAVSLMLLFAITVTSWILQPGMAEQSSDTTAQISKPHLDDQAAMRAVVDHMLRERQLNNQVKIDTSQKGIILRGSLAKEQLPIVQRMVDNVENNYQLGVPLINDTEARATTLPFRITQITDGSKANIVTDDGQRLFIGDEHDGFRLVRISANEVQFSGQDNSDITVNW
ncbi:FHA domain-containing protein [Ewingella americana]|jgi:type III secretion protein D|uniref:FHA domain-containing protein n=1 Tax=Ewingella americana TaxID=41202 RepID=UPI00163973FF|nr:FHA domain-containing protein [Ewingella americana]QMV50844.1 type III secretion protein HrpQ [Ewingella americana]